MLNNLPDRASVPYDSADWIAAHSRRSPGSVAFIDPGCGRRVTYLEADRRVQAIADRLLASSDISPGERVATLMCNSIEFFLLLFACRRLGTTLVPLNWRLSVDELDAIVAAAAPRVLICDSEFMPAGVALEESQGVKRLLESSLLGPELQNATGSVLHHSSDGGHRAPATILFTSGTSGTPKGAIISGEMLFWNALNILGPARIDCRSVALAVLPSFHTGGLNLYALPTLYVGGTVVIQRRFDANEALEMLTDKGLAVTHFFGVPTNYLAMAQLNDFSSADLRSLVTMGVGGAPLPTGLWDEYVGRGTRICNGYGMTETGPVVMTTGHDVAPTPAGDVGRPVHHVDVRLVDRSLRPVRGDYEVGEVAVRGPAVSRGYWGSAAGDRGVLPGGWFRTGDAAYRTEEGRYFIVDRWKEMYISGGENVYPAEVEQVIYEMSDVAEAAVVSRPDTLWGERGVAVVVLKPGAELSGDEIISHCRSRLAHYKVPDAIRIVSELPHNSTGKVVKASVRKMLGLVPTMPLIHEEVDRSEASQTKGEGRVDY